MRIRPSSVEFSNVAIYEAATAYAITALTITQSTSDTVWLIATVASGLTANRPCYLILNNNAAGFVGFSAEL
jgi:hypothetical protein